MFFLYLSRQNCNGENEEERRSTRGPFELRSRLARALSPPAAEAAAAAAAAAAAEAALSPLPDRANILSGAAADAKITHYPRHEASLARVLGANHLVFQPGRGQGGEEVCVRVDASQGPRAEEREEET